LRRKTRRNFTFLWALGALSALAWVFEPALGQAIETGGILAGPMTLGDAGDLWLRGAVAGLFVLLGLYEQTTLSRLEGGSGRFQDLLEALPDMVWTARDGGPREFLSPGLKRAYGHTPDEYARGGGRLWWDGVHPDDRSRVRRAWDRLFTADAPFSLEYRVRRGDGAWIWVEERSVLTFRREGSRYANGIVRDITERKRTADADRAARRLDPVTSLPGRELLEDRLRQAVAFARRHRHQVAVLYVGVGGLREAADTLGRGVADPLLKAVAKRLRRLVREEDTVARHDDLNLVVVLPDLPEARHAARVTQAIIAAVDTVFEVRDHHVSLGANVGLSFYPTDGHDPEVLIKNAAAAMERSRRRGRNTYEIYTADLHRASVRRLKLEATLRRALDAGQLGLHFQPQIDLASGAMVGLEALVRWTHPEEGPVSPGEFIPLAEETGLILPLGAWVLNTACMQMQRWQRAGLAPPRVSVNVSARQLEGQALVDTVTRALKETRLDPHRLELEITESALVRNADEARAALERLKAVGVGLAVDDFGTGQAALAYLKRFPVDTLKIDRAFVASCADDAEDAAIVRAVIAMAHSLRLTVVGEGVETEAQLAFLKAVGCDAAQGYLLGRPGPAEAVTRLLAGDPGKVSRAC
jgi:diguanylate cyclase (GGDEF)-like protein/PAS domain S-box-containing protein